MKERIVINQDWLVKDMKAGVPELDKLFICQKVEQVPETFEELKELCKDLESKKILTTSTGIIVKDDYIEFHGLQFWVSGTIAHETEINEGLAIRLNRTPAQMWQIIKSLIGE